MTTRLKNVKIAPKGMGLNDFVASHEGYFAAEGLHVEFDWKTFRGTQSSWKDLAYFERPQDKIYAEGEDVIKDATDESVRDAGIIAAAQKVEHYEMAAYGTLRTFAEILGNDNHAALLNLTLEEEKNADAILSSIADTANSKARKAA